MEAVYDYATTDIALPTDMANFLLEWNELNIPEDVLFKDEDGGKGREDEPHITVKYGLLAKDVPPELREIVKDTAPFPIVLGNVSLFQTNPKFDVVKLGVKSPWLHTLNRRISDAIPHEDTYPDYNPHATLAYVEKGSCDHMIDDDPFKAEGVVREFMASGLRFAGAGDSEDAGRVEEMLLFSKTKHPGAVTERQQRRVREDGYAQQRQEIETWASTLVEGWLRRGLTTEQMTRRLRSGEWECGVKYWANRRQFPQAFHRFVERVNEYIEDVREAKFAEAVTDVDPFANCSFPVDPDRTKQFLRNNGRRRSERTVL